MRIDISGQRLNSDEHIASSQTTTDSDLESQTDLKFMQKESSKGIDAFQKENINIEAELQDIIFLVPITLTAKDRVKDLTKSSLVKQLSLAEIIKQPEILSKTQINKAGIDQLALFISKN